MKLNTLEMRFVKLDPHTVTFAFKAVGTLEATDEAHIGWTLGGVINLNGAVYQNNRWAITGKSIPVHLSDSKTPSGLKIGDKWEPSEWVQSFQRYPLKTGVEGFPEIVGFYLQFEPVYDINPSNILASNVVQIDL